MIEDPELCALFKAECEEHLQTLETGLLRLEAKPSDSAMLEELFRSAHSLKGAARMLGVEGVETLAHHFEDELGAARRGHLVFSSATADRLYFGLDAIRRLAREASDGEPAHVDIPLVLAHLRGVEIPALSPVEAEDRAASRAIGEGDDNGSEADQRNGRLSNSGSTEIVFTEGILAPVTISAAPEFEKFPALQPSEHNGSTVEPMAGLPSPIVVLPPAQKEFKGNPTLTVGGTACWKRSACCGGRT